MSQQILKNTTTIQVDNLLNISEKLQLTDNRQDHSNHKLLSQSNTDGTKIVL